MSCKAAASFGGIPPGSTSLRSSLVGLPLAMFAVFRFFPGLSKGKKGRVTQGPAPAPADGPAKQPIPSQDAEQPPDTSIKNRGDRSNSNKSGSMHRNYSNSLVTSQEKHLSSFAAFSPAIAHWELAEREAGTTQYEPASWELRVAILFVDISGFTNLCTRLDIDSLQRHINRYFTALIDIVVRRGGDVLRFAGDAIFCAWSLAPHADDTELMLATHAACACALELNEKCATYPIPEIGASAGITSAALPLLGRRHIRTPPGCKDPCRSCGRQSAGSAAREPLVAS